MTSARSGHHDRAAHPAAPQPASEERIAVMHGEMDAACERGAAVPLARSVPWLMRYRGGWWVVWEHGWVRVREDLIASDLDRIAARMAAAEDAEEAARHEEGG